MPNLINLAPCAVVSRQRYYEEARHRLTPLDLCEGAEYYARVAHTTFGIKEYAGDYLTEIREVTPVRKRLVWPSVLQPCAEISLVPVSSDGHRLEDTVDTRLISPDGYIYSHGLRVARDGYIKSAVDECDFALGALLYAPKPEPSLMPA
jgi:hypothetical protein